MNEPQISLLNNKCGDRSIMLGAGSGYSNMEFLSLSVLVSLNNARLWWKCDSWLLTQLELVIPFRHPIYNRAQLHLVSAESTWGISWLSDCVFGEPSCSVHDADSIVPLFITFCLLMFLQSLFMLQYTNSAFHIQCKSQHRVIAQWAFNYIEV